MSALHLAPAAATVNALARAWAVRHPELAARLERAVALVANVRPGDRSPNVYFVEGSAGHRYMVRINRAERSSSCSCEDHAQRGLRCKHILAAALVEKGREIEVC